MSEKKAVPTRAVALFVLNVYVFFYKYFRVSVSSQLYTEIHFPSEKELTQSSLKVPIR